MSGTEAAISEPAHPDGLPTPRRYWAMLAGILTTALIVLDGTLLNVALPQVAKDLHATPAQAVDISNAAQITSVVLLLPLASLGEIVGYRRLWAWGMVVFIAAAGVCSIADNIAVLTAARFFQGAGGAAVMAVSVAQLRLVFPHSELGRGLGVMALAVGVTGSAGPSISGAILSVASWRGLFIFNICIGLGAFVVGIRALPNYPGVKRRFDWLSAVGSIAVLGGGIAVIKSLQHKADPIQIAVLALATAAVTVLLIRRERRQAAPVLPLDLLRIPTFAMAIATSICTFMAMTTAIFALPFFLQVQLGEGKVMTGLLMTPWPLCAGLCAPLSGRLADRYSAGVLSSIGLAVMGSGLAALALLPAVPAHWMLAVCCGVCGAGVGFFQSPNNRAIITSAPLNRGGGASGMMGVARGLGQAFGGVLAAIVFGHVATWGYNAAFAVAAGVSMLAALVSLSRLKVIKAEQA